MDIRHLKYFVCLAEELHFGRAAEKLHIAQPALSIQIKNLEDFLGGALFERNKRNVTLTDAGQLILVKARHLLNEMDGLITYADMIFHGRAGNITISYSGLAAYSKIMGDAITHFRKQYPDVQVNLEEHDPWEQLQHLKSGKTHVAFMTTMGLTVPAEINAAFLASYPLRFIFPAEHPLAHKEHLTNDDLEHEPFVIYASPSESNATSVVQKVCGFSPRISHRVSSALLLPSLVGAGLGIALIPSAFDNIARERGTVIRPLPPSAPEMDISFLFPQHIASPAAKTFVQLVKDMFLTTHSLTVG